MDDQTFLLMKDQISRIEEKLDTLMEFRAKALVVVAMVSLFFSVFGGAIGTLVLTWLSSPH